MTLPSEIAEQFEWDFFSLRLFCAAVLEDANDHQTAAALRAIALDETKLACDFLKIGTQIQESRGFSPGDPIAKRIAALHEKLEKIGKRADISWYPWE